MTETDIKKLAGELLTAHQGGQAISASDWPSLNAQQAYAIQDHCAHAGRWFSGKGPRAWKVGAASRDSEPNCAPLPDKGLLPDGTTIAATRLIRVGIEAEVALRLGRDVPDLAALGNDRAAIESLVDALCVSIELVDSRFVEGAATPAGCKLADLQLHGALVTGAPVPFAHRDWDAQRCTVSINDALVADVVGAHPLGDPLWTTRWLIEHACRRFGGMHRGDLITTGAWTGIMPVQPGDVVEVSFEGIGTARMQFAA